MAANSNTDIGKFFRTKNGLYVACLRNQVFCPPLRSGFMSSEFMMSLIRREAWLPKITNIRLLNAPDPPAKSKIKALVVQAMKDNIHQIAIAERAAYDFTIKRIERVSPTKQWLLAILSTL